MKEPNPYICERKAYLNFERAINYSQKPLNSLELLVISSRYGLFGEYQHNLSDIAIRIRQTIPDAKKILKNACDKSLNFPILNLLNEAYLREVRFLRFQGKEGNADLEMACRLLKKADLLNDCRIVYHIKP